MNRTLGIGLLTVALAVGACAQPLVKPYSTSKVSEVGIGRVQAAEPTTVDNGESRGSRAAMGFLAGGIAGAAFASATEAELGTSRLQRYEIGMADGQDLNVTSFSPASVGDCVRVTRLSDSAHMVLERQNTESIACEGF